MSLPKASGACRRLALQLALAALVGGLPAAAQAQAYPARPIKLIIPASPGGSTDVMGRLLAKVMSEQNAVPVVVENKAGASGSIGVQTTVTAPPDGYTIMFTLPDATTIYPLLKKNPPYRVDRDLTSIAQVAKTHVVFAVTASSPIKTVHEFVAQTKQRKMSYGSNGFGTTSHLWIELFKQKTGADLLHVPYKGAGPAMLGLIGGETDFIVASPASLKAHLEAGRIRPLVATSPRRLDALPNVATMVESGYPDFVVSAWFGVFGPPNMNAVLADKLHEMVTAAVNSAEFRKQAAAVQFEIQPLSRDDFTKMIAADAGVWRTAIDAAGIKPED